MSEDVLLSHSGPVLLRSEADRGSLYTGPGTLVLWKWLGLRRFFPQDRDEFPAVMRMCSAVRRLLSCHVNNVMY